MNIFTKFSLGSLAIGMLFLSSCASTYKPLHAPTAPFSFTEQTDGLIYSYQYDMLQLQGNRKYAKREIKKHVKVVAMRVTNTTDSTIHIGNDYKFMLGNTEAVPVAPIVAAQQLKQGVAIYLLYLMLNVQIETKENNVVTSRTVLPTGPPISAFNIIMAADANSKFKRELITQNIQDKSVAPGETVFGLISLRTITSAPVRLERRRPVFNTQIQP